MAIWITFLLFTLPVVIWYIVMFAAGSFIEQGKVGT